MNDKKKGTKVPVVTLLLRVVVAGYLIYLAWQLKGNVATHVGTEKVIIIVSIIVFAAVGVLLGGYSLIKYLKRDFLMPGDDGKQEEDSDEGNKEL